MKNIKVHIEWGNSKTEEWEPVVKMDFVQKTLSEYFSEFQRTGTHLDWRKVTLPSGEQFDISVYSQLDQSSIALHVRKYAENPLLNVTCNAIPSVAFRTPLGADVSFHFEESE